MEWPFKWSLPAPLLWQFFYLQKYAWKFWGIWVFIIEGESIEAVLPPQTRIVLGENFWSSAQSPENWLNQGSNMANIIYFFLNAKQFLMCPRQHQCLSWGVKLGNIFSLCGKASCSSVSKEIFKVLLLMQFLFSYYYDADISFSFSQSRILLDSLVKFYIYCPFNHILCL